MEEKILLAELMKNCGEKREKLVELLKAFDLAEIGRDLQRERFKEIENRVLAEHEFFCGRDVNVRDDEQPRNGDRILSEEWTFLLSDKDFTRYQETLIPYYVEAGLTDEKGYYVTNWDSIVCDARCELVEYIIKEILPAALRPIFWEYRNHIIYQEKLIKITKDAFVKKAA